MTRRARESTSSVDQYIFIGAAAFELLFILVLVYAAYQMRKHNKKLREDIQEMERPWKENKGEGNVGSAPHQLTYITNESRLSMNSSSIGMLNGSSNQKPIKVSPHISDAQNESHNKISDILSKMSESHAQKAAGGLRVHSRGQ